MTNEKTYCDPFNWVIKLNNKGTPFKNSAVSICCPHTEVKARNLAELLPIYYCAKYGGSFICACEANWFRQFGRSRLDQRLREASIAEKICVACRGERILLSDMEGVFSLGDTGAKFQKGIRNYS
jgi:hypothetical protein